MPMPTQIIFALKGNIMHRILRRSQHLPSKLPMLAQINQNNSCTQALATTTSLYSTRLTPWVRCRDFFTDSLLADDQQKEYKIYGYKAMPYHGKFNSLLLKGTEDQISNIISSGRILTDCEKLLNFRPHKIIKFSSPTLIGIQIHTTQWAITTWNFHFLSLIMKCLTHSHFLSCSTFKQFWEKIDSMPVQKGNGVSEQSVLEDLKTRITLEKLLWVIRVAHVARATWGGKLIPNVMFEEKISDESICAILHNCGGLQSIVKAMPGTEADSSIRHKLRLIIRTYKQLEENKN